MPEPWRFAAENVADAAASKTDLCPDAPAAGLRPEGDGYFFGASFFSASFLAFSCSTSFGTSSALMTSILAPLASSSREGTLMISLVTGWAGCAGWLV